MTAADGYVFNAHLALRIKISLTNETIILSIQNEQSNAPFLSELFVYKSEDSGRDDHDDKRRDRAPDRVVNFVLPDRPDAKRGARDERDRDDRKGNITDETRFDHAF